MVSITGVLCRVHTTGGKSHLCDIKQKSTCDTQSSVDLESIVEVGVVNEAFPSDSGSGFFKVNPHNDEQVFFGSICVGLEQLGVLNSSINIVY